MLTYKTLTVPRPDQAEKTASRASRRKLHRQIALVAAALASACVAEAGTIKGRVLNQGTNEYLRNAVVSIPGTNLTTNAEAGGAFELRDVPAGVTKIEVAFAGLDTVTQTVNVPETGEITVDVAMTSADYAAKGKAGGDTIELQTFVVATDREGNAKAIMEQKASLEAKKVIATDSFGAISEGNAAEFLKYLPGVMVDYTEADARSVSLGGLDPKYTAITLDGAPIASSGLAAASGTSATRAFEFEQISINSIETVDLARTPQPENPGSALAGVVNLRSKGAFDRKGRLIQLNAGMAANSLSGNPFKKQPGWDDEDHYRIQPNWGIDYSDVFLNNKLGVRAGYNYSYTFSEQKAETVLYSYDTDLTNNATEVPRVTQFSFRDSPKPTIRYNTNLRVDYKFNDELWVSARAEYNNYHAKFFSRDMNFNFTTTANSPVQGTTAAGPVVAGTEYSLSSQTATVGTTQINQGGGGTNKYGETINLGLAAYFKRGAFRADVAGNYSRSQTWYKDQLFGFFWSINPSALTGLGFRFNRNGPADPGVTITQTSGADFRDPANYPAGFSATTTDRRGEDQKFLGRVDMQYDTKLLSIPTKIKWGVHVTENINNADRPMNGLTMARIGADGQPATADEKLNLWLEPRYRMQFDYGGNIDGMPNVDRWALYKDYQAHPEYWVQPTAAAKLQSSLQNARDAKEQVDAIYNQTIFIFGRLTVAPGVRVEHTRGSAAGPTDLGNAETQRRLTGSRTGTVATSNIDYVQTRYGSGRAYSQQDYTTPLGYLHTSYRITPNLVMKSSFNQSISRPDMNWLTGGLIVSNENPDDGALNQASAGNEKLKPEESRTINVTLEYYLKGIGNITGAFYRRDFSNFIRALTITVPAGGTWNGDPLPTSVSPNEAWLITTRDNLSKAHLTSEEFSITRQLDFIPGGYLRGARVTANYTHVDYDNYNNFLRAQNVANLMWYFPYRNFRLSWNTNWREGYRVEIDQPITFNASTGTPATLSPTTEAARGWAKYNRESLTHTLDFGWDFRRNMSFYITARNIFNQDQGEYRGRSDFRTRWVQTGAIWTTGIKATF